MYYGRVGFGIALVVFHLLIAGGFLYFMYCISKSLKKIADSLEKKPPEEFHESLEKYLKIRDMFIKLNGETAANVAKKVEAE